MNTLEKTNHKNNEVMSLFEVLIKKHKELYKKYSPKSALEYWTKNEEFGVSFTNEGIHILNDRGTFAQLDLDCESYGASLQSSTFEFDANTSDDCFQLYLSYDSQTTGQDVYISYSYKDKTIMFEEDILEFDSHVKYPFKTRADKEEILFKLSLEYGNTISYDELVDCLDNIKKFKSYKIPKNTNVQIWSYKFPMNLKELLENI